MEISFITDQDVEPLAELYQQLLPNEVAPHKMRDVLSRNRHNPRHMVLAAKLDGKLAGSLLQTMPQPKKL